MGYFSEAIEKINDDYPKVVEKNEEMEDVLALNDLDVDKKFEFEYLGKTFAYNPEREYSKRFVVRYSDSYDSKCQKVKFLKELDSKMIGWINTERIGIISKIEKELGTCAFD